MKNKKILIIGIIVSLIIAGVATFFILKYNENKELKNPKNYTQENKKAKETDSSIRSIFNEGVRQSEYDLEMMSLEGKKSLANGVEYTFKGKDQANNIHELIIFKSNKGRIDLKSRHIIKDDKPVDRVNANPIIDQNNQKPVPIEDRTHIDTLEKTVRLANDIGGNYSEFENRREAAGVANTKISKNTVTFIYSSNGKSSSALASEYKSQSQDYAKFISDMENWYKINNIVVKIKCKDSNGKIVSEFKYNNQGIF